MRTSFRMLQLTVLCANMPDLLFKLNMSGVGLHHICWIDELTVSFYIHQDRLRFAKRIIQQAGGQVHKVDTASANLLLTGLLRRPVLIAFTILLLFLSVFIPTRVLFITVVGNERIPQQQILEAANGCGIRFGMVRHEIRSEKIKNQLLEAFPGLKWVGVNTKGCVAQISVQERRLQEIERDSPAVSSLVASCDGVITNLTVRNGNPMCRVGQAVRKGELLVSGYFDCGRCIYGTRADADVYAQTRHTISVVLLTDGSRKEALTTDKRKFGLIVGKKRINFYKGSGISDASCVRMYKEYPLTLPGGFQLPVAWVVQYESGYTSVHMKQDTSKAEQVMDGFARAYLEDRMIAGRIHKGSYQITETDGAMLMAGQYICDEMIGQTRSEEIVRKYE